MKTTTLGLENQYFVPLRIVNQSHLAHSCRNPYFYVVNLIKFCIFFFVFFPFLPAYTQEYQITNYDLEDGLISDYIYELDQSSNGFIYVATDAGLATFSGKKFQDQSISVASHSEIIDIFKDSYDRMWLTRLDGKVLYHKNGKFNLFSPLQHIPSNGFVNFVEDNKRRIWIWNKENSNIFIFDAATLEELKTISFGDESGIDAVRDVHLYEDLYRIYRRDNYVDFDTNFNILTQVELKEPSNFTITSVKKDSTYYTINGRDQVYITTRSTGIYEPLLKEIETEIYNSCNDIIFDNHDNLWLSTSSGLLRIAFKEHGTFSYKRYLEGINTSAILLDQDNNIWVGSSSDGIFKLNPLQIKTVTKEDVGRFTTLEKNKQSLLIGTDQSKILIYDQDFSLKGISQSIKNKYNIYGIKSINEGSFYFINSDGLYFVEESQPNQVKLWVEGFFKTFDYRNGYFWYGGGNTCGKINVKNKNSTHFLGKRSYAVDILNDDQAFLGSTSGLHMYDHGKIKPLFEEKGWDIRDIESTDKKNFWLATNGEGLIHINSNEIVNKFDVSNGLSSNICKAVYSQDSLIWVGTNNGLNRLNLKTNTINIFKKDSGLPSNEINDIISWKDQLIVATNDGLAIMDKDIKPRQFIPNVNIAQVKILEKDTSVLDSYDLNEKDRNIKINFEGITFYNPQDIKYEYKMSGIDEDWVQTTNDQAQYTNLTPGNYTFAVKAKGLNSNWSDETILHFNIPAFYYEKTVFKIGIGILATGLFILGLNIYLNAIRKREQTKTALLKSQLTALRAQMNPHFIFNSLNSLSDFILKEEKKDANKFLTKFAKLMRMILNNSSNEYVSIEEEIESLNLYLSLEKLRFNDDLKYSITLDQHLNGAQCGIPSLLLQPYVENALIHGLKHKKGEKELSIKFEFINEDFLKVFIIDNGIGRKKANAINNANFKKHESLATHINAQRLNLINQNQNKNHKLEVHDLYHESQATGTKIELTLEFLNLKMYDKNGNHR